MKEKNYINAINEYQIYKPIAYYKVIWINNYNYYYHKILKAIDDTDKEFIIYQNNYIDPFIHISNNGYTDTLKNYPYLEKIASLWDYASPYYLDIKDYTTNELEQILKIKKEELKNIKITEISNSNYIKKIKIGNKEYTGKEIKEKFNLKSTDITIIINPTNVRFITKGWGHNLGISQFGANEIAKSGCSYTSIIKYYFPNVTIKKYI
jgi:stage II sporulation protein D